MKRVAIDIGCGEYKHPGSVGVDIAALRGVDVQADVTFSLPFQDSCVDAIYATHVLEHFDNLTQVMDDIWRVCKPGARLYVTVPHATSSFMTWRDPTHRRGLNLSTLSYFDKATLSVPHYYSKANFRTVYSRLRFVAGGRDGRNSPGRRLVSVIATDMLEAVANGSQYRKHLCERWWGHWFGVAEAYAVLEAVK